MAIARDMLRKAGWPEEWINDDKKVQRAVDDAAASAAAEEQAGVGMGVAEAAGKALRWSKALQGAKAA